MRDNEVPTRMDAEDFFGTRSKKTSAISAILHRLGAGEVPSVDIHSRFLCCEIEFGFYHLARTNNFEIDDVRGGGWSLASLLNDGGSKPNNEPSPTDRCDVASNFEIAFVNSLT
jgi:hypothetical protein